MLPDARRIRNGSETGPAPAWLNRAAVPLDPEPIPVPPGPPSRASSSSPNGTRSQRRRPGGATGAPSGAGSAPRQPTNDLKSPYGEVTCLAFSPTEFSHRHAMLKLAIRLAYGAGYPFRVGFVSAMGFGKGAAPHGGAAQGQARSVDRARGRLRIAVSDPSPQSDQAHQCGTI